jgi:hypothetical protein
MIGSREPLPEVQMRTTTPLLLPLTLVGCADKTEPHDPRVVGLICDASAGA